MGGMLVIVELKGKEWVRTPASLVVRSCDGRLVVIVGRICGRKWCEC